MRTLLVTLLALFLLAPVADFAEAKRLGGGSKIGKSFSAPKKSLFGNSAQKKQADKPAAANTAQGTANNAAKSTAPAKKKGFGGLMAGLLAGGIFGALLFGGAFEGIEMMDLLLIAGIIFVVWKIFSMRRKTAPPQQAYAGGPAPVQTQPAPESAVEAAKPQTKQAFEAERPQAISTASSPALGQTTSFELPEWFNKQAFLDGATSHFGHLQAAWDRQDWDDIATYTSEEVLEALKSERANHPAEQTTEVVSVMAELANCINGEEEVIVTVNFYGWLKEDSAEAEEFNEYWHLSRDMTVEGADWLIVGIEQVS